MIKACYSDSYTATTETISMSKLSLIAEDIKQMGLAELIEPTEMDIIGALRRLHCPNYVDSFISGQGELATSNGFVWSEQVRDGVIASNAGMLTGANMALEGLEGKAVANIGQGYHHAEWGRGGAFCTFNGLALIAQENPTKKIFVLDCDEHQGDGTQDFVKRLPNLWNFSIFGTRFRDTEGEGSLLGGRSEEREVHGWRKYESALWDGLLKIDEVQPDLVLYQAGVDCHKDDGMGMAGLTTAQLEERDCLVFEFLRDSNVPVLFCMAGGYGANAVQHHLQTFKVAVAVYG